MKKIFSILVSVFLLGSCKTLTIAMNPSKGAFNSGTIGSVRATDNIPASNTGTANFNFKDAYGKADTVRRDLQLR
jgi:hypothetical protein